MSDYYRLNFSFALSPYAPTEHVSVFKALASNERPRHKDLKVLHPLLRDFLRSPSDLGMGNAHKTVGSSVQMVGHGSSPESPYSPRPPEWEVRFCISMHDDWYANGGYFAWMLMPDIVGDNGLYCTEFTENQKDSVTHYYKDYDDVVLVRMEAPFTRTFVPDTFS